jgi:hypothetical protein
MIKEGKNEIKRRASLEFDLLEMADGVRGLEMYRFNGRKLFTCPLPTKEVARCWALPS